LRLVTEPAEVAESIGVAELVEAIPNCV